MKVQCPKGYDVTFEECYERGLSAAAFRVPKGKKNLGFSLPKNPCRKCKTWREQRERIAEGAELLDDDDRDCICLLTNWPDPLTEWRIVVA